MWPVAFGDEVCVCIQGAGAAVVDVADDDMPWAGVDGGMPRPIWREVPGAVEAENIPQ